MKKAVLSVLILLGTISILQAQGVIKGKIWDAESLGEPLMFAEVRLADTQWSTKTNLHGNFEMHEIASGDYILTVDYLGYGRLELPVRIDGKELTEIQGTLYAKRQEGFGSDVSQDRAEAGPSIHDVGKK